MTGSQRIERELLAPIVTQRISAFDTDNAFVLQYVPELGTGGLAGTPSTAATVAFVLDTSLTFLVDGAAPTGADAIGTAGVIDVSASTATYNTLGEVEAYINGLGGPWRMILHAGLRADTFAQVIAKGAASCIGAKGLAFQFDSTVSEHLSLCVTGEHFVNNGKGGHLKDWDDNCLNQLMSFECTLNMASNGLLTIYEGKQGATEVLVYSSLLTDATSLSKGEDFPQQVWLEVHPGYRLIVRAIHASDLGTFTAGSFHVRGKTIVQSGERQVTKADYAYPIA